MLRSGQTLSASLRRLRQLPHLPRSHLRPTHTAASPGSSAAPSSTPPPPPPSSSPLAPDGLPADPLPRYPARSTQGVLRALDYLGTVSFANSGAMLAAANGMDILGASIVGTITAVGGGTIRDALILSRRPFWTDEVEYLYLSLATAMLTFAVYQAQPPPPARADSAPEVAADAAGVAAFCVIGAQNAVRANVPSLVAVICGVSTATFGGVVRDLLVRREVRILHSTAEIYASTAAAGAASYLLARRVGAGVVARVGVGLGVAGALRMWAYMCGIRLPVWDLPSRDKTAADKGAGEVLVAQVQ